MTWRYLICTFLISCNLNAAIAEPTPEIVVPTATESAHSGYTPELLQSFSGSTAYDGYLFFSPNGRYLAYWAPDIAQVFDIEAGSVALKLPVGSAPLAFSKTSESVYSHQYPAVQEWTVAKAQGPKQSWKDLKEGQEASQDAWRTQIMDDTTVLYAPRKGRPLEYSEKSEYGYYKQLSPEAGMVAYLDRLEWPSSERTWSYPSALQEGWEGLRRDISTVAVSQDGKTLALGTMGGSLVLVDIETEKPLLRILTRGEIRCLDFSADGRVIAMGCGDLSSDITVVDVHSRQALGSVSTGTSNSWAVALSDDGRTMAVASDDGKIRVWRLPNL